MDGDLIEKLAAALHKNAFWDETKSWEEPSAEVLKLVGWRHHMMPQSKEEWRWMARRFVDKIGPKFGITVAMTNVETTEEVKYPKLRLLQGGKGPPMDTDKDWLSQLKKGAVFTCKKKGDFYKLLLFIIAFKHEKTIVLVDGLNNNPREAVDPAGFCQQHSLFELIEEGGHEELPKEEVDHDNSRQTDSDETLVR